MKCFFSENIYPYCCDILNTGTWKKYTVLFLLGIYGENGFELIIIRPSSLLAWVLALREWETQMW